MQFFALFVFILGNRTQTRDVSYLRIVRFQESLQYSHVPDADHVGVRGGRDVPPADQRLH